MKECTILFALCCLLMEVRAQDNALNKGQGLLFKISYAAQWPGADLVERFGSNYNVGLGLDFITNETNWIGGIETGIIFGRNVKTDVLAGLRTPQGFIIGNDRVVADIQLRQRGWYIGGLIGKIFALSEVNRRSGIRLTLGAGVLQHKIRIQDDPVRGVAQLSNPYKKGYDRLTNGLALTQFVGYQVLSRNKRINFFAGFEFTQGFTQSRRDFNFDTRMREEENRLDLLYGIRVGWILPFYFGKGSEDIYY